MNICLFSEEEIGKPLSLNDKRAKHIVGILHKNAGDTFFAGVIGGMAGSAKITSISKDLIHYTFSPETSGKELAPLQLVIGFPRPIQLRRLFRDVAGLGVSQVHLVGTELGEKSYLQSSIIKTGEAERLLLDGTVQAASTHVPALFLHNTLYEYLSFLNKSANCKKNADYVNCAKTLEVSDKSFSKSESIKIALDLVNTSGSFSTFLKNANLTNKTVIVAIGSERGWTDNERNILESAGFTRYSMGKRILRTETAATVASSLVLGAMGRL